MANSNPMKARQAKRRNRTARVGDVHDLQQRLWEAVEAASDIVRDTDNDAALRLRGVHAVTQAAQSYTRLIEASEFEARLRALEEADGA